MEIMQLVTLLVLYYFYDEEMASITDEISEKFCFEAASWERCNKLVGIDESCRLGFIRLDTLLGRRVVSHQVSHSRCKLVTGLQSVGNQDEPELSTWSLSRPLWRRYFWCPFEGLVWRIRRFRWDLDFSFRSRNHNIKPGIGC